MSKKVNMTISPENPVKPYLVRMPQDMFDKLQILAGKKKWSVNTTVLDTLEKLINTELSTSSDDTADQPKP